MHQRPDIILSNLNKKHNASIQKCLNDLFIIQPVCFGLSSQSNPQLNKVGVEDLLSVAINF